jgi:hypothetical protein
LQEGFRCNGERMRRNIILQGRNTDIRHL